jgi:hypothetical protein
LPQQPLAKSGESNALVMGIVGALGLLLLCGIGLFVIALVNSNNPPGSAGQPTTVPTLSAVSDVTTDEPTPEPPTLVPREASSTPKVVVVTVIMPPTEASVTQVPTETPTELAPPTDTPEPPTATPTIVQPIVKNETLGRSAGGRDIPMTLVGYPDGDGSAIVVVGGIAGEQTDTTSAVHDLIRYYENSPGNVRSGRMLYFIPDINPDGGGSNHYNANGVDLNRNWGSYNWTPDPPVVGVVRPGAGGPNPFSEPETRALRDLILSLRSRDVRVLVLHSSANRGHREVFPGYTDSGIDGLSQEYALQISEFILGFQYDDGGSQPTTGELIAWSAEQGVPAVDIFWSRPDGNRPSQARMVRVVEFMTN